MTPRRFSRPQALIFGRFARTRCAAPVTAAAGVLACVATAGTHGVCDDHHAWRSFVTPLRILWSIRRWWPNELGREMDRSGRERARGGDPLVTDGQIHGKLLDDTRCCPAGWAGAFTTVFLKVVTCQDCRSVMETADAAEGARRAAGTAAGTIVFQSGTP